ncbi:MAG: HlyD family secretion protein [Neisseriales bacterium]|nr:MAG: HlyD family secretion protein [Neisseriales bacterium]
MNKKTISTMIKGGLLIVIAIVSTYFYMDYSEKYPTTEDAYVNADLLYIAPKVSGYVTGVSVTNNQFVHKGDTLFKIETDDYSVQLSQEQQAQKYAEEQLANAKTQISTANANLENAKVNYNALSDQLNRYTKMQSVNAASLDTLQKYQTQFAQAKATLEQNKNNLVAAKIQVAAATAKVLQAQASVQNAKNHVGYTDIIAPSDGYVSNLSLVRGQYVSSGQQLFGLIDSNNWWIDANYKETEIEQVKIGQPVDITLDIYKHVHYKGIVQSISYASGSTFSLMPAQNATGNWVKVTQRFTIRVQVQNSAQFPLRVGASARAKINTSL